MAALRLRLGGREFAPRLVPTLLMLPVLALLLWLGTWQLERAGEKRVLWDGFARGADATAELPVAAPLPRYAHVRVAGRFVPERQVLLDNMTQGERGAGYRVLTPLERGEGPLVLVDRGWVPLGRTREELPDVAVASGERVVTGRVDELPRAAIDLPAPTGTGWPRVASFPTRAALEAALGRAVHPQIVLLDADQPDGFRRDWQPPGMPPERHVGYAVQWYGLALTLVAIWVIVNLRKTDR